MLEEMEELDKEKEDVELEFKILQTEFDKDKVAQEERIKHLSE